MCCAHGWEASWAAPLARSRSIPARSRADHHLPQMRRRVLLLLALAGLALASSSSDVAKLTAGDFDERVGDGKVRRVERGGPVLVNRPHRSGPLAKGEALRACPTAWAPPRLPPGRVMAAGSARPPIPAAAAAPEVSLAVLPPALPACVPLATHPPASLLFLPFPPQVYLVKVRRHGWSLRWAATGGLGTGC